MLKCLVVNPEYNTQMVVEFKFRPNKDDILSINYTNERVSDIVIITPMLVKTSPELANYDLLVYIN